MRPRELVARAFRFEEVRPVPYHIWTEPEVEPRWDAHYGTESWREELVPYIKLEHFGAQAEELEDGT